MPPPLGPFLEPVAARLSSCLAASSGCSPLTHRPPGATACFDQVPGVNMICIDVANGYSEARDDHLNTAQTDAASRAVGRRMCLSWFGLVPTPKHGHIKNMVRWLGLTG